MRNACLTAGLLMMILTSPAAHAHKVIAAAFASGEIIEGEIGFSNGDMAAGARVEVFDLQGTKLGEALTDSDGVFSFTPTKAVPHVFRADLGAGHTAETVLGLDELPVLAGTGDAPITATAPATIVPARDEPHPPTGAQELLDAQRLMIAEMIRAELRPLRREIAAYKEKNDFQTILGGLGYIAGLFGLWFYFAARRRQKAV